MRISRRHLFAMSAGAAVTAALPVARPIASEFWVDVGPPDVFWAQRISDAIVRAGPPNLMLLSPQQYDLLCLVADKSDAQRA